MTTPEGGAATGRPARPLALALCLTGAFAVIELVVGWLSGSLALISDAGHMGADTAGLALALAAATVARWPSDRRRTYGYARAEVLVVPLHALLMLGIAGFIAYEAFNRLGGTPDIAATPVLITGAVGLGINLLVLRLLLPHHHANLNVRGALLEVAADGLASIGVILAAVVILTTGWTGIDLIVSLAIAALVLPRTAHLLRQALGILLEGVPPGFPLRQLEDEARSVPGVLALHDLHVWTLAPSFVALSAHVEVDRMADSGRAIAGLTRLFADKYGVRHVTLQPETPALHDEVVCCFAPDRALLDEHVHTDAAADPPS